MMKTFPNVKLLPCPFCGSKDVNLRRNIHSGDNVVWWVECCDCGVQTSLYEEDCTCSSDPNEVFDAINDAVSCAVETWNHRASDKNDYVKHGKVDGDIDVDALNDLDTDTLTNIGKRVTDALVNKVDTILSAIDKELKKHE